MSHSPLFRSLSRALNAARRANHEAAGLAPPRIVASSNWTRRRFLATAAAAAPAVILGGGIFGDARGDTARNPGKNISVAVIGGGIAGLNAALHLKKADVKVSVFEASRRLGGRIMSQTGAVGEGLITELGAEFINTDHEDMLNLIDEFGLPLFNRLESGTDANAPTSGFYFEGKVRREAEIAAHLRPLAQQIAADAALLDEDYEKHLAKFDLLSVAGYLDQHAKLIPEPYIRKLVENAIRTEYGVEPAQSTAMQLLFNLPTVDGESVEMLGHSDEALTVQGGNSRIIDGLAAALGDRIHLRKTLKTLQSKGPGGFRLEFEDGHTEIADYVVVAIPFHALRKVQLDVELPEDVRQFINELELGSNEKLIAGFSRKIWRKPQGFAGEAWTDLGFSEIWDATQRQDQRKDGALTFYFGGSEVAAADQTASDLQTSGHRHVTQLDRYIPGAKDAATGKFLRTSWTKNASTHGAYSSFKPGQLSRFGSFMWVDAEDPAEMQQARVGNLLFAGEHLSDAYYGFMNGAAETGRLAAQSIVASLIEIPQT